MPRKLEIPADKQIVVRITTDQYKTLRKIVKASKGESQASLIRGAIELLIASRGEGIFG